MKRTLQCEIARETSVESICARLRAITYANRIRDINNGMDINKVEEKLSENSNSREIHIDASSKSLSSNIEIYSVIRLPVN